MLIRLKENNEVISSHGIQLGLFPEREGNNLKYKIPQLGDIVISPTDIKSRLKYLPTLVEELKKEIIWQTKLN
ncbi:hypothetical protein O4H26_09230 [Aequorivita viscosa]|nr:hypothetical protein [Aequorivita viscosa]